MGMRMREIDMGRSLWAHRSPVTGHQRRRGVLCTCMLLSISKSSHHRIGKGSASDVLPIFDISHMR